MSSTAQFTVRDGALIEDHGSWQAKITPDPARLTWTLVESGTTDDGDTLDARPEQISLPRLLRLVGSADPAADRFINQRSAEMIDQAPGQLAAMIAAGQLARAGVHVRRLAALLEQFRVAYQYPAA